MLQVELTPWHGLDMMEEEEVRVGFWIVLNWAFDQREIRKMDCSQGAYRTLNIDVEFLKHFDMCYLHVIML